ncbi:MAG TPA: hypothetical protein VGF64_05160 [Acidimicrobiales bacterium]
MRIPFRRAAAAGVGLALGVVALGGCASAHNSLGTGSSTCFQALPSATDAVHSKGRLLGVRRVALSQLRRPPTPPTQANQPNQPNQSNRSVCVVAFQGKYAPGDVANETMPRSGNFAIVVVGEHGGQPLRAFVTDTLPLRFRHLS